MQKAKEHANTWRAQQRETNRDKIHMFTKSSQSISQVHVKLEAEGNEEGAGGQTVLGSPPSLGR